MSVFLLAYPSEARPCVCVLCEISKLVNMSLFYVHTKSECSFPSSIRLHMKSECSFHSSIRQSLNVGGYLDTGHLGLQNACYHVMTVRIATIYLPEIEPCPSISKSVVTVCSITASPTD